jgi:hypothetical protein
MTVPDEVRDSLKSKLWTIADEIDWLALGPIEKSQRYENWAHDPEIGGVVSRYMDVRQVRVYIKDTLLKKYPQVRLADTKRAFRFFAIPDDSPCVKDYIRPHGRQLADGRVVCWGRAADWKSVLMAAHERAFGVRNATPYAVLLLQSAGKYGTEEARSVVIDAAAKLGIEKLLWNA